MNEKDRKGVVVMGISARTYGIAFAVFRGPWAPQRWGVRVLRGDKNRQSLLKAADLIARYQPDVIVIDDYAGEGSRRAKRIETLIDEISELARGKKIRVHRYSRAMMRECFSEFDAFTKFEIAQAIAKMLSEFAPQLPPKRKIWLPEDPRMGIFDAVALVFSFFYFDNKKTRVASKAA